jgi:hypothetical protein
MMEKAATRLANLAGDLDGGQRSLGFLPLSKSAQPRGRRKLSRPTS